MPATQPTKTSIRKISIRTQRLGLALLTMVLGVAMMPTTGHAQYVLWAESAVGTSEDEGQGIGVDAAGNSYVTGHYSGTVTFGSFMLTSAGSKDIFVAKYDSNGNVLWAQSVGGSLDDRGKEIAVDAFGNSHVTGFFQDTVTFGSFMLTSTGGSDIFVAKFDTNGNVLWAQSGGGSSLSNDITIDTAGNSYITGSHGGATFGAFTLTDTGFNSAFMAKYDSDGTVLSAQTVGGLSRTIGKSIAIDAFGNILITGDYLITATFGSSILTSAGSNDTFVAKFDSSGSVLWAQSGGGINGESARGIGVDAAGNSYVVGTYNGTVTFGPYILTGGSPVVDTFLVKYDSSGNVVWAQSTSETTVADSDSIAVDADGNSYVTGFLAISASFGPFMLNAVYSLYIVKYDSSGIVLWARAVGGFDLFSRAQGIAIDSAGNSYITGRFRDMASFGSFDLIGAGPLDIFVAKLSATGCDALLPLNPPILAASPYEKLKVKYISIDASTNCTCPMAIKITETTTGKVMWAGVPFNGSSIDGVAALSSTPFVNDWCAYPVLHLTGCIIQPTGAYEIMFVEDPGGPAERSSAILSASTTCKWGDVQVNPGPCDVGIGDIIEAINIATFSVTAVFSRPHGDLQGNVMDGTLGIGDIIVAVNSVVTSGGTPIGYTPLIDCP